MRTLLFLLAAAAATLASASLHAELYKWVDKNGMIHYSDSPPARGTRMIAIRDRLSLYSPDPALAQALQGPSRTNAPTALTERIGSLERQLQSERLARSSAASPDARAAYERCLADRRTDCDQLPGAS